MDFPDDFRRPDLHHVIGKTGNAWGGARPRLLNGGCELSKGWGLRDDVREVGADRCHSRGSVADGFVYDVKVVAVGRRDGEVASGLQESSF